MHKNISCAANYISDDARRLPQLAGVNRGMKQYIRDIMNDLKKPGEQDFIPEIPQTPAGGKTVYLDPPKVSPAPEDLENQGLSSDQEEKVEQLDYQAQKDEERETLE